MPDKTGFWNYTEPIIYRAVLVRVFSTNEPPMHWQNAFHYTERQAIEIKYQKQPPFYIDNEDGSGLQKVLAGGGPGSMSRHIQTQAFEIINAFIPEEDWKTWNPHKCAEIQTTVEAWQKKTYPAEFEKLQRMKQAWDESDMNPRGKNFRFKK